MNNHLFLKEKNLSSQNPVFPFKPKEMPKYFYLNACVILDVIIKTFFSMLFFQFRKMFQKHGFFSFSLEYIF